MQEHYQHNEVQWLTAQDGIVNGIKQEAKLLLG